MFYRPTDRSMDRLFCQPASQPFFFHSSYFWPPNISMAEFLSFYGWWYMMASMKKKCSLDGLPDGTLNNNNNNNREKFLERKKKLWKMDFKTATDWLTDFFSLISFFFVIPVQNPNMTDEKKKCFKTENMMNLFRSIQWIRLFVCFLFLSCQKISLKISLFFGKNFK